MSTTYKKMKEVASDTKTDCGCFSKCCKVSRICCSVQRKRFAQCALVSTITEVLFFIPTVIYKEGYHGEKGKHTIFAGFDFTSIVANAASMVLLFKDSKNKQLVNIAKIAVVVFLTGVTLLADVAAKKTFKSALSGSTMSLAQCMETTYTYDECMGRNAKIYTGMPQVAQLIFALAEHVTIGVHLVLFLAVNGALHPEQACWLSKKTNACVQKVANTCCPGRCILKLFDCCGKPVERELQSITTLQPMSTSCCLSFRTPKWVNECFKQASPERTDHPQDGRSVITGPAPVPKTELTNDTSNISRGSAADKPETLIRRRRLTELTNYRQIARLLREEKRARGY